MRPEPRVGVLGAVEKGVFFGMGGAPLPDALPLVQLREGGLARLDAVEQVRPHLPIRRPADVGRAVPQGFGRVGAQTGTHLREGEAALVILAKDPHGREGAQQPVERLRIDGEGGGQLGGAAGAIAEAVGDPERRRHVDRLGHLVAIDQPMQTDRWPFFVWHHCSPKRGACAPRVLCTPLGARPSHVLQWPRRQLAQALLVFSSAPLAPNH